MTIPNHSLLFSYLLSGLVSVLLSMGLSTEARAQDNSGVFSPRDEGQAPNTDSETVPGLQMSTPTFAGTGCPQGTATATLSPDGRSLSVLFDQYVVEAGTGQGLARAQAGCEIQIPFSVPQGYAVQVVKMDYRGFASLPAGARSGFYAGFRFLEINGRATAARKALRQYTMFGPKQDNFVLTSIIQGPEFSPCGQNFILAAQSIVNVQTNQTGEQALASVDSLDGVQTPVVYSLRWKRCQGGGVFRPPLPGRPGGPGRVGGGDTGPVIVPTPRPPRLPFPIPRPGRSVLER